MKRLRKLKIFRLIEFPFFLHKDGTMASKIDFVLRRSAVILMATACGACVANLYYMQPLLSELAGTFQLSQTAAGFVLTVTQIGYALGLFLFVPMGDMTENRSLILKMLIGVTIALLAVSVSLNYPMLVLASFIVGITTITPQLLIPFAAHLADEKERGKIIGTLMSGLLIGILLSRTFSGTVGAIFGWRTVYMAAAVVMIVLMLLIWKMLPKNVHSSDISYRELISSTWPLIKKEKIIRDASINGALMFGSFSIFWTALIFLLETPAYNMGAQQAGLFGLVGVSGILAASVVGRLADRKDPKLAVGVGIIFAFTAYLCFLKFGLMIWGLIIGVILLDIGNQTAQVSNQARIQAMDDEVRNRNNMIFMTSYFVGGAFGSFFGGVSWQYFGWTGVCELGILFQSLALVFNFLVYKKES